MDFHLELYLLPCPHSVFVVFSFLSNAAEWLKFKMFIPESSKPYCWEEKFQRSLDRAQVERASLAHVGIHNEHSSTDPK